MNEVFLKDGVTNVKVGSETRRFEVREGVEVHGITTSNDYDKDYSVLIVGCHKDREGMMTPILWYLDGSVYTGDGSFLLTPYEKFKPCPFCGNIESVEMQNKETDSYNVLCNYEKGGCGARGGVRYMENEAKKVWNERA